jgi:hypothetical protein
MVGSRRVHIGLARLIGLSLALSASLALGNVSPGLATVPTTQLSDLQVGELQQAVDANRDIFGGLWANPDTHQVTINVVRTGSDQTSQDRAMAKLRSVGTSADPDLSTGPKRWKIRMVTSSKPSLATLDGVLRKVTTVQPWATHVSGKLVTWGIDPQRQSVRIGVTQLTSTLSSDAQNAFGDLAYLVVQQRPKALSRLLDSQPYWGGDRIVDTARAQCTAGFATTDNSTSHGGMLTAGHCWGLNVTVQQGYVDGGGGLHTSGNMGKVTKMSFGTNGDDEFMDSAAVGSSTQGYVFYANTSARPVHRVGTNVLGLYVCVDGSFTGEVCVGQITQVNFCADYGGGVTVCHLVEVKSSITQLAQRGDSGGPVYGTDQQGGDYGLGTISAGVGSQPFTDVYYADLSNTLSNLNLTIKTA